VDIRKRFGFVAVVAGLVGALAAGCSGGDGAADVPDAVVTDVPGDPGPADPGPAPDDGTPSDVPSPDADPQDATPDAPDAWEPPEPPWVAPDDHLRLAMDRRDIGVPVGIPAGGYGQMVPSGMPKSPFADLYMATTRQLHPPRVQALGLLKGDRRLLLVQTDLVAPFWTLFSFVVQEVRARTGLDVTETLVLLGNHSHQGPGRYLDTPLGVFFMDNYDDLLFQAIGRPIADAVVAVLTEPAVPVDAKVTELTEGRIHRDRRCENPERNNDAMGLLRFDTVDAGAPRTLALVISYAIHGTVYGWEAGMLSGDAPRSIEMKVEEELEDTPMVVFTQSWTGDVSPTDPSPLFADLPGPASQDPNLDRLEALGRLAAETILAGWDSFVSMPDPVLDVVSLAVPISWADMGYQPGEWDHPNGALLCGGGLANCTGEPAPMFQCIDMDEGWVPASTRFTAWRLGELGVVTLPGEPLTPLADAVLAGMLPAQLPEGAPNRAWVMGYAQDYTGYLLLADDYQYGGYEGSMALWGPRQGEWTVATSLAVYARLTDPEAPLPFVPATRPEWHSGASVPHEPVASVDPGVVVTDLPAQAAAGDVLTFAWRGGDPWVDRPEVVVEESPDGTEFAPLVAGGRVIDQRDYRTILELAVDPLWQKAAPTGARTFTWTVTVRTGLKVPAPRAFLDGTLRIRVAGKAVGQGGAVEDYQVVSGAVSVAAPESL
jgi:hypothetical protein